MAGELISVPLEAFVCLYVAVLRRAQTDDQAHQARVKVDRDLALLPFPDRAKINLAVAAALRT